MIPEKVVFKPNNRKDKIKQAEKHMIIALRTPNPLDIHPEKNPPVNPPAPSNIMLKPRCCPPSASVNKLCTHVGSQEKIAHKPISIEPKMIAPLNKLLRCSGANKDCVGEVLSVFDVFHFSDSFNIQIERTAIINGIIPIIK